MDNFEKINILAVVGPTASGKTALSVALAERLDGEIVSCDSMQIYRGMDIGTAKPTEEEKRGIPHHLIDVVSPDEAFSCADYTAMAEEAVNDIVSRRKLPIFCGGTGLYLDSFVSGNKFVEIKTDENLRRELSEISGEELYRELCSVDPESAEAIHPNNKKRVARAVEIYRLTGTPKSEWDRRSRTEESRYAPKIIGLRYADREVLYKRIDLRVDIMVKAGLVEEVEALGLKADTTAAQAIGYKEITEYLNGSCSLDYAIDKIKQNTRNYAKRQLTWFGRNENIRWITLEGTEDFKNIVNNAINLINE